MMTRDDLINTDQTWVELDPNIHMPGRNSARKVRNSGNEIAFFKTPPLHVQANEALAYIMSERLNLPCAKIKFAKLFDNGAGPQTGILSFRVLGVEPIEWPLVPAVITNEPKKYLMNSTDLAKIAIFDVWTYNIDRSTANIVISKKTEWGQKFLIYMIDHEESFYGYQEQPNRHEGDGQWENVSRFVTIPTLIKSIRFSEVEEFIIEIESMKDEEIVSLMALIPSEYYNPVHSGIVLDLLRKRRDIIRRVIQAWCESASQL